jgi:hypothetical protein
MSESINDMGERTVRQTVAQSIELNAEQQAHVDRVLKINQQLDDALLRAFTDEPENRLAIFVKAGIDFSTEMPRGTINVLQHDEIEQSMANLVKEREARDAAKSVRH